MLRYKTEIAWCSRLVRHPARKWRGSILATPEPHWVNHVREKCVYMGFSRAPSQGNLAPALPDFGDFPIYAHIVLSRTNEFIVVTYLGKVHILGSMPPQRKGDGTSTPPIFFVAPTYSNTQFDTWQPSFAR